MEIVELFAIALPSVLLTLFCIAHRPSGRRLRAASSLVWNRLIYGVLLQRHSMLGPWGIVATLCSLLYIAAIVCCLCLTISVEKNAARRVSLASTREASVRAAYLALVNAIPLYLSPNISYLADLFGLGLSDFRALHRACGVLCFLLFLFHVATQVWEQSLAKKELRLDLDTLLVARLPRFLLLYIAN